MKTRLLAALLSVMILLTSCVQDTTGHQTLPAGESTDSASEEETETEEEPLHTGEYPVGQLTVAGIDISEFSVVVEVTSGMSTASGEFIELLALATGVRLSRVQPSSAGEHSVVLGTTSLDTESVIKAREGLNDDGYAVICEGGNLYITGKTERGTFNGIYSFLEEYVGVNVFADDCVTVDRVNRVTVEEGFSVSYNPGITYRDSFWYNTMTSSKLSARLKINSGQGRDLSRYGGAVRYAGPYFVHTLSSLSGSDHTVNVQPCLTDENVYQTVLKNVRAALAADPDAKIISVSQNDSDSSGLGCQCANCKAIDEREGTPMGSLLTFVNRLAREIRDEYPDVYIDTLAYRYTRQAPKTIKPEPNVIIRLCSIECCFCHPLDDESCERNMAFKKDIEEWSAICENLYVWDYTTNFMHYIATFPNFEVLWENVRFYAEHNVVGLFEQGNYQSISGEFGDLRSYLLAKLLWNPDMTKEEYYGYMDKFLQAYYGPGWENIRAYIDRVCEITGENTHLGIYDHPTEVFCFGSVYKGSAREKLLEELEGYWAAAYEMAETDLHKAHVERSSLQMEYVSLYLMFRKQVDRNKALYSNIKKYGITNHRESTPLPELSEDDFKYGPSKL